MKDILETLSWNGFKTSTIRLDGTKFDQSYAGQTTIYIRSAQFTTVITTTELELKKKLKELIVIITFSRNSFGIFLRIV